MPKKLPVAIATTLAGGNVIGKSGIQRWHVRAPFFPFMHDFVVISQKDLAVSIENADLASEIEIAPGTLHNTAQNLWPRA